MKVRILFFVTLLALAGIVAMQSCKKDEPVAFKSYVAAIPAAPTPGVGSIIPFTGADQAINLAWTGTATNAPTWDVYFGSASNPALVASGISGNTYTAHVSAGGTYYWRVSTVDVNGIRIDNPVVWSFEVNSNPDVPVLTAPADQATAVSKAIALTWTATDPESDNLTYDIYLGTTAAPGPVATGLTAATYSPTLDFNTTYYWKVVAKDPYGGVNTSAVFSFTTDVFHPDFSVFSGIAAEACAKFSASKTFDVIAKVNTVANTVTLFTPLGDAMVYAGWGTVYSGAHGIVLTYDPVTMAVTGAKQLWMDSFIDPNEMGPMSLTVSSGTIDAPNKKITVTWTISGNDYWGGDYTLPKVATYTMK